ncbi:Uncharacterized protein TPAR_03081, partial [Tolypocladium paradoxum]
PSKSPCPTRPSAPQGQARGVPVHRRRRISDDWNCGAPVSDIKRLAAYWRDDFDWRAQEARLNEIPQFTTTVSVDGFGELSVHLVHQGSSRAGSIPLFFCHGCRLLGRRGQEGFSIPRYAETLHKVMLNLGYDKYGLTSVAVTQGGDKGFIITRLVGMQYPDHCLASHINVVRVTSSPKLTKTPLFYLRHALQPYSELQKQARERTAWFAGEGFGYNLLQSTKPSMLGFALADSPFALLAWVYEKPHDWTNGYPWTGLDLRLPGSVASARMYYEAKHAATAQVARGLEYVPRVRLGFSILPRDLIVPPRTWARTLGPVVFEKMHDSGGHVAAHERPEELAGDLRNMYRRDGGVYDVAARRARESRL